MVYAKKNRDEILRHALRKLERETDINAIGPGSVARSITEVVTNEIGDFYETLDFNTAMGVVSTAQGRSLELIGRLYNVERKRLGEIATLDERRGSFYFYIEGPSSQSVTVPAGTGVYTDESYLGRRFRYATTQDAVIAPGRLRAYVGIRPQFNDSVYTVGADKLVKHDYDQSDRDEPTVYCTNPKPIAPQKGYESDDELRERIVKKIREYGGGTKEAIRNAALHVEGVREARVISGRYGLGSVKVVVSPEGMDRKKTQRKDRIMAEVSGRVGRTVAAGIRTIVDTPDMLPVDLDVHVKIRPGADVESGGTARKVEIGVRRFLNQHLPGDTLYYSQLINAMMESSDAVADVKVKSLKVDREEVPRRNFRTAEEEQIVPSKLTVEANR